MRIEGRGAGVAAVSLAVLALGSSGCVWLALGGAGYAGYRVASDPRPVGTQLDDATITTAVKARLVEDPVVSALAVGVDTFEGVVTLHGRVPSPEVELRAMRLAEDVRGVERVESRLEVPAPAPPAGPAP